MAGPSSQQASRMTYPSQPINTVHAEHFNGIKMELAGEREPCGDQAAHLLSLRLPSSLTQLWAHPSGHVCLKRTEGKRGTEEKGHLPLSLLLREP